MTYTSDSSEDEVCWRLRESARCDGCSPERWMHGMATLKTMVDGDNVETMCELTNTRHFHILKLGGDIYRVMSQSG